ncbi:hypothetical protein BBJ28_00013001 [Nothophytophthora sp. Chile5]|nr:hypothetical protein BBJ28_00013001 [Nothophytophthora sp. Chile5]
MFGIPAVMSENDSGDEESLHAARSFAGSGDQRSRKRVREDDDQMDTNLKGANADVGSLTLLKDRFSAHAAMVQIINKVVTLHQSALAIGSACDMVIPDGSSETKAEFRPSVMQRIVHRSLVNCAYAHMGS